MKKLQNEEMELMEGGGIMSMFKMNAHDNVTVMFCAATVFLVGSPLAPVAAATGLACAAGLYSASMYPNKDDH